MFSRNPCCAVPLAHTDLRAGLTERPLSMQTLHLLLFLRRRPCCPLSP